MNNGIESDNIEKKFKVIQNEEFNVKESRRYDAKPRAFRS